MTPTGRRGLPVSASGPETGLDHHGVTPSDPPGRRPEDLSQTDQGVSGWVGGGRAPSTNFCDAHVSTRRRTPRLPSRRSQDYRDGRGRPFGLPVSGAPSSRTAPVRTHRDVPSFTVPPLFRRTRGGDTETLTGSGKDEGGWPPPDLRSLLRTRTVLEDGPPLDP